MEISAGPDIRYESEVTLRTALPAAETHYDTVYVPIDDFTQWELDPRWGLYDLDGDLVEAAAYRRRGRLIGQSERHDLTEVQLERAPRGKYLYGGTLVSQFGHFLLGTLARFWVGSKMDLGGYKIVCHGSGNPDGWFSHRFVAEIFGALGLTRKDFVVFKRPTLIPEMVVPRPCAQEHDFVHSIYGELGNTVGTALVREHYMPPPGPPVWLAKFNMVRSIQGFVNEIDLTQALERRGVEILHPQNLLLAQQVMLYATRPAILGTVGSAFHNSILWPPHAKLVCLNPHDRVNSNCAIADKANGNRVSYIQANARLVEKGYPGMERFDQPLALDNIEETADRLLAEGGLGS